MAKYRNTGSNPRAKGTNPRAAGTNPRAVGTNPRSHTIKRYVWGTVPPRKFNGYHWERCLFCRTKYVVYGPGEKNFVCTNCKDLVFTEEAQQAAAEAIKNNAPLPRDRR